MATLVQTGYGGAPGSDTPIEYEYTGSSKVEYNVKFYDGIPKIEWKLKLLTSGKLRIKSSQPDIFDVFLVGGGGGSGYGDYLTGTSGSGGGGGGYVKTSLAHDIRKNTEYDIIIGSGGVGGRDEYPYTNGGRGGTTSAFGLSAEGGYGSPSADDPNRQYGYGGNGGSGGGSAKRNDARSVGKGSGKTTREFGEDGGTLYAGGGGGGAQGDYYDYYTKPGDGGSNGGDGGVGEKEYDSVYREKGGSGGSGGGGKGCSYSDNAGNGTPNTGGGAGGTNGYVGVTSTSGHKGGSGIVVIRGRYSL